MAADVKPTLEAVWAKTGGSYNTPSLSLAQNLARLAGEQAAAVIEMPEQVVGAVKGLAAELWEVASSEAAARTRAIEETAEARASDAETEAALTAAINEIDTQAKTLAEALSAALGTERPPLPHRTIGRDRPLSPVPDHDQAPQK